jgi:hypothetical protein
MAMKTQQDRDFDALTAKVIVFVLVVVALVLFFV